MEQGSGGEILGEDLLCKIWFPFMGGLYLAENAMEMIQENPKLEALVLESCLLMSSSTAAHLWAKMKLGYLNASVLVPRHGREVIYEQFSSRFESSLAAGRGGRSRATRWPDVRGAAQRVNSGVEPVEAVGGAVPDRAHRAGLGAAVGGGAPHQRRIRQRLQGVGPGAWRAGGPGTRGRCWATLTGSRASR